MPVYRPTDATGKLFPGDQRGLLKIGDPDVVTTAFIEPTPVGFELVASGSAPWVTEYADTLPASVTDLAKYTGITIWNDSGQIVECVVNGDTANPLPVFNGAAQPFSNKKRIATLDITGSGTGNVYVVGDLT